MSNGVLAGASVLVTRPAGREEGLCRRIMELGGVAERLPLLEIVPGSLDVRLSDLFRRIDGFDIVVFVSVNAVEHGLTLLRQARVELPRTAVVAAVGRATAVALEAWGVEDVLYPEARSNSEELLEFEPLARVGGSRVLIFRGQDGRELLAETLRARGAEVEYAPVYERRAPAADFTAVVSRWLDARRPVLVLTSDAAAKVLMARTPPSLRDRLKQVPLAVLSERQRDACREAGWQGPIGVCDAAGDDGLTRTIVELFETHCRQDSR